jgi:hypothetical protein
LEGGFSVGIRGVFDGFCGSQDCAFQKTCASAPARVGLTKKLPAGRDRPRMLEGKSAKRRLRAEGVLFHGKRVREGGQTGKGRMRLFET